MRILVSGASGLIGSALSAFLGTRRVEVVHLSRAAGAPGVPTTVWNPLAGELPAGELEGFDAVVHLAGENIAAQRWTPAMKARIRTSRVEGTHLLAQGLAACARPPRTLVCASAIGYYGDRGEEVLDEDSEGGAGFLAEVVEHWEEATYPAQEAGIRVLCLRFGVVLSPAGGALARMLPPFRFGLGGPVGSGRQYMSWVTLGDAVGAIDHALRLEQLEGALNVVTPQPVTQREFARALGRALHRPAFVPLPAWAVRLLLGEMGQELLLSSTRVQPRRLLDTGYDFEHQDLASALADLLSAPRDPA